MAEVIDHADGVTPRGSSASARLQEGVSGLRVPEPSGDVERNILRVAMALPIVGLLLVAAAWFGASGTGYVADQIPYLISGALLGLGLVLIGVGLFVRYSLARLVRFSLARVIHEQQAQGERVVEAMGRVEAAIRDATRDVPVVVNVASPDAEIATTEPSHR